MTTHELAFHSLAIIPEPERSRSEHGLHMQHKFIHFYFKIQIEKPAEKLISCLGEYKVYTGYKIQHRWIMCNEVRGINII